MIDGKGDVSQKLSNFLLTYQKTPQSTTMEAPAMLLQKRIPWSRIDLIRPNIAQRIRAKQEVHKKNHDKHAKPKEFAAGDLGWARDYRSHDKWTKGQIKERTGQLSYSVQVQTDLWKRHAEQLRARVESVEAKVPELVQVPTPDVEQRNRHSTRTWEPPARLTYTLPGVQSEYSY